MQKSVIFIYLSLLLFITVKIFPAEIVQITRLSEKIIFNGLPDEPVWDMCTPLPFVMHSPTFGLQPTEKTEAFLAYDSKYLYFAGRLYMQDSSLVRFSSKKRDYFGANSDWFGIILDTFNDNENGLGFFTTPAGLRCDFTVFNDAEGEFPVNLSWDTYWDVKTIRNHEGWFCEMRIPFSSLRYQEINGKVTMGVISWRWMAGKNEHLIYPAIPQDWGGWSTWKPSKAQKIELSMDIQNRTPIYMTPYVLGGYSRYHDLNDEETAYDLHEDPAHEIGLDLKYGLTSNLTLDVTLNTDFAQVEADDQQINLTRFSLFFPEKRRFFQERSSNFEFSLGGPNQLFYSRRIGLNEDGEKRRIYGGARLVGRQGCWDIGILNMHAESEDKIGTENLGVYRFRRQVFNPNSYTGGIMTSRLGPNGAYNIAYGLDGIFKLKNDTYLSTKWAQTFADTLEGHPFSVKSGRISMNLENRKTEGFGYEIGYTRSGVDFNPGLGFQWRDDYTRVGSSIHYGRTMDKSSRWMRYLATLEGECYTSNTTGKVESVALEAEWELSTKSNWFTFISLEEYYEDVPDSFSIDVNTDIPPGEYQFLNGIFFMHSPGGKPFFYYYLMQAGTFYDGWKLSAAISPTCNFSSDLELSGYYEINRIDFKNRQQNTTTHLARLKATWTLSTAISFISFVQVNNISDVIMTNFRFRYNPKEGNDFYLVYDEGTGINRHRHDPILPHKINRSILLKYTYSWIM